MGRILVLGDVHGAAKALKQVLQRSKFDRTQDRLIFLGDVADGWSEVRECIDIFLTIPDLIAIKGNHDSWFQDWLNFRARPRIWTTQGGMATLESYNHGLTDVPDTHKNFINSMCLSWVDDKNRLFVHGGIETQVPFERQKGMEDILTWDRSLWMRATSRRDSVKMQEKMGVHNAVVKPLTEFAEVYIGHTSVTYEGKTEPQNACEVWNMDTGAGWSGKLSIMDVDTKEFWQSEQVEKLYPDEVGRRK